MDVHAVAGAGPGKRNAEVGVWTTEEQQRNKGAMLYSGMQGINSGAPGTRNREINPSCAMLGE